MINILIGNVKERSPCRTQLAAHNSCETIFSQLFVIEDVPFGIDSTVIKKTDRREKDKLNAVGFVLTDSFEIEALTNGRLGDPSPCPLREKSL